MELFLSFLKQRRLGLVTGGACVLIFLGSFALYHLPVRAVLYPAALCVLVVFLVLGVSYWRVLKRHRQFGELAKAPTPEPQQLPKPQTVEGADYNRLLTKTIAEFKVYQSSQSNAVAQTVNYYTVWMHQIKTPISSMRLRLQNEDTSLSRALSADLLHIEQYVEMALTYLRLDFEHTDYLFLEYSLADIAASAIKRLRGEFINRRLKLNYLPAKALVITDEKWLQFVIEQVLSNALKYTPAGSITVLVEPQRLTVADTGIGIAPQDLPRIFESGFTGYNGRADKRASGIGLYLCKRICSKLGHEITVQSTPGKGTTVVISFAKQRRLVE